MFLKKSGYSVNDIKLDQLLIKDGDADVYKDAIYLDLEHYVYKVPICIGVFGVGYFCNEEKKFKLNQYILEGNGDNIDVLMGGIDLISKLKKDHGKKYMVTFSGNNDFLVIEHLLERFGRKFDIRNEFISVDLQNEFKQVYGDVIGLKHLEKIFGIEREGEVISGSTLAKTISKVYSDEDYFKRMPKDKIEKILTYNAMDVYNLFLIVANWKDKTKEALEEKKRLEEYNKAQAEKALLEEKRLEQIEKAREQKNLLDKMKLEEVAKSID